MIIVSDDDNDNDDEDVNGNGNGNGNGNDDDDDDDDSNDDNELMDGLLNTLTLLGCLAVLNIVWIVLGHLLSRYEAILMNISVFSL